MPQHSVQNNIFFKKTGTVFCVKQKSSQKKYWTQYMPIDPVGLHRNDFFVVHHLKFNCCPRPGNAHWFKILCCWVKVFKLKCESFFWIGIYFTEPSAYEQIPNYYLFYTRMRVEKASPQRHNPLRALAKVILLQFFGLWFHFCPIPELYKRLSKGC